MNDEKRGYYEENSTTNEKLEVIVKSYLRGVLLLGGLITVGLGSMFLGDKVLGIGVIVLLLGLFYHSFGGLVCKALHLALAAIVLLGATALFGISKLASLVQERQRVVRANSKQDPESQNEEEFSSEETDEPVFKRVVLDGDIEQDTYPEEQAEEVAEKPVYATADVLDDFDEDEILRAGLDREEEYYNSQAGAENIPPADECEEIPTGFIPNEDIPGEIIPAEEALDEGILAYNGTEDAPAPVKVRPRRVTSKRLPNGARITVRSASLD